MTACLACGQPTTRSDGIFCSASCRNRHYQSPAMLAARFWPRVQRGDADDCWPWTGQLDDAGYGRLVHRGKRIGAHRIAHYLATGAEPDGMVLHSCDNPPCCNPAHLRVGTHEDNMADMIARKRGRHQQKTHCSNGHPFDERNTYWRSPTSRMCRRCRTDRQIAADRRRRAAFRSETEAHAAGRRWLAEGRSS